MKEQPIQAISLQRSRGRADVGLEVKGAGTGLARLYQSGSAKAMLPSTHGAVPEVVLLNTSGGLTGGDGLFYGLTLGPGAAAIATTQTAERAYATAGGSARVEVLLRLGAGAALDWLPQETILFDRSALTRRTLVDMAADARLLMLEMLVLGRTAMGERVRTLDLYDRREVRRGGRVVLVDPLRLGSDDLCGQSAILGEFRAIAALALVAPDAGTRLDAARQALAGLTGVEAGASAWDGKLTVRILARDGYDLRRAVLAVLPMLRQGPLPRVWQI